MTGALMSVALMMLGVPGAGGQAVTERVPVKNVLPSKIVTVLRTQRMEVMGAAGEHVDMSMIPPGVRKVSALDNAKVIVATGSPQALAELSKRIMLLDVVARSARLDMRIIRKQQGEADREIGRPVVSALNNEWASISVTAGGDGHGYSIRVQPRVNGDGSVSVDAAFRILDGGGVEVGSAHGQRRIAANLRDLTEIASFQDGANSGIQYALEVRVTLDPAMNH